MATRRISKETQTELERLCANGELAKFSRTAKSTPAIDAVFEAALNDFMPEYMALERARLNKS
jgi:hypothetical protein